MIWNVSLAKRLISPIKARNDAVKKCKLRRDKYCSSNGNASKWTDTLHFLTTPYNRSKNAFLIKSPYYNVPVM